MSVQELEKAVMQLSPDEFREFADWYTEYAQKEWDHKIEADSDAGKLNHLIAKAQRDFEAGRYREL